MFKLSICAIAKNEQFGLEEWINYHYLLGVEHFYIYDNDSEIPVKETLKKYIDIGIVNVIDFPGLSMQMPAYTHCLQNFGKDNEWIGFIDCDEFILPKQHNSILPILNNYTSFGGLAINWIIFGSNGHKKKPDGLVIENYTKSSLPSWKENLHVKCIVQPRFTVAAGNNPHYFVYNNRMCAVSEKYITVPNAWTQVHSNEIIQINHYTTKSEEEFAAKINKGRADAAHLPTRKMSDLKDIDNFCTTENTEILKFKDKLEILNNITFNKVGK